MTGQAERQLPEEGVFMPSSEGQIFGLLHQGGAAARLGIVLMTACAEEKLWSHRAYVGFARRAARTGVDVLRVDCRGEGESDLEFQDSTLGTRVADALAAVDYLRSHRPELQRVLLLGHRVGSLVCVQAAAQAPQAVDGLVLWDPVFEGRAWLLQMLRQHLSAQLASTGRVNVTREELLARMLRGERQPIEGYDFSVRFVQELCEASWGEDAMTLRHPTLLVEVAGSTRPEPSPRAAALAREQPLVTALGVTEQPFWREIRSYVQVAANLTAATLDWLDTQRP